MLCQHCIITTLTNHKSRHSWRRVSDSIGRGQWCIDLSTVPRGSCFVYYAKQPWNNCFITQPMLKIPVFSPRTAILIGTQRQYTQLTSWRSTSNLVTFDVINQAIGKTIARCFSITFIGVMSHTCYNWFYGPADDVIWATFHVCGCGACQLSCN